MVMAWCLEAKEGGKIGIHAYYVSSKHGTGPAKILMCCLILQPLEVENIFGLSFLKPFRKILLWADVSWYLIMGLSFYSRPV